MASTPWRRRHLSPSKASRQQGHFGPRRPLRRNAVPCNCNLDIAVTPNVARREYSKIEAIFAAPCLVSVQRCLGSLGNQNRQTLISWSTRRHLPSLFSVRRERKARGKMRYHISYRHKILSDQAVKLQDRLSRSAFRLWAFGLSNDRSGVRSTSSPRKERVIV